LNFKNFNEAQKWLIQQKYNFEIIAQTNECRKWSKWVTRNETPFPCVCPVRNEDCIFAETYYKLSQVASLANLEKDCEEAILDFQIVKYDDALLKSWIEHFEDLYSKISSFKNNITITISPEPYEKLKININFPTVVEDFKAIYSEAMENT
jgi:adenosine deaminase